MNDGNPTLRDEIARLAAQVELQHRHIALLRSRLRETMAPANLAGENGGARPPAAMPSRDGPRPAPRASRPDPSIWPCDHGVPAPLTPTPGLTNFGLRRRGLKVLGIAVCGLGHTEREAVVDMIDRQQQSSRDFVPVFFTDSTDFETFRSRGFVFEYLPPPRRRPRGTTSWQRYAADRLDLLRRKWNIATVVTFGQREFAPGAAIHTSVADAPRPVGATAGAPRGRIVFYPDYSQWNPYQQLLYRSVADGFDAVPGDLSLASAYLAVAGPGQTVVFHLHWEDAIYKEAEDERHAAWMCRRFGVALRQFIGQGGAFMWTVHNLQPHEPRFARVHAHLCRTLGRLAHRIHVHSRAARAGLRERCEPAPAKVRVIAHGNYRGLYGPPGTRAQARRKLGLGARDRVLLFFGKVRAYKGVDELVRAFDALDDPRSRLVIAGRHHVRPTLEGLAETTRERISIIDRDISGDDVPNLFRAADFAVLPYKAVLTSGSLLLALSLGTPVVVPRFPSIREIVADGAEAYLYDPTDAEALAVALQRAVTVDGAALRAMGRRALATARRFDWKPLGREYLRLFQEAGAAAPSRRPRDSYVSLSTRA